MIRASEYLQPPEPDEREYHASMRRPTEPRMSYRRLLDLAKRGRLASTIAGWRQANGVRS